MTFYPIFYIFLPIWVHFCTGGLNKTLISDWMCKNGLSETHALLTGVYIHTFHIRCPDFFLNLVQKERQNTVVVSLAKIDAGRHIFSCDCEWNFNEACTVNHVLFEIFKWKRKALVKSVLYNRVCNIVLLTTAFRPALRPTGLRTQWSQGSTADWAWILPFTYLHKNARKCTSCPCKPS